MEESRKNKIGRLAGNGELDELKRILIPNPSQLEIDIALENAIAYSQISTAKYLLSIGADFSNYNFQGVYYAAHNNELEGIKFSISNGVDIDVNNGMLLNTSIITSTNSKKIEMVKWLLDNGANIKYLTKKSIQIANKFGTDELKQLIKNAI